MIQRDAATSARPHGRFEGALPASSRRSFDRVGRKGGDRARAIRWGRRQGARGVAEGRRKGGRANAIARSIGCSTSCSPSYWSVRSRDSTDWLSGAYPQLRGRCGARDRRQGRAAPTMAAPARAMKWRPVRRFQASGAAVDYASYQKRWRAGCRTSCARRGRVRCRSKIEGNALHAEARVYRRVRRRDCPV